MIGHVGPYESDDGDVWVPRTVPYLEARRIAKSGSYDYGRDRLVYVGRDEAELLGFTRSCQCEEVCEDRSRDEYGYLTSDLSTPCRVEAWHFRLEE
jgi:hypothetical protein